MLFWLPRPTENSITITGRSMMTKNSRYTTTKAAPPYWPVMQGSRHTLPSPMAHPADMSKKPSREEKLSRCFMVANSSFLLCRSQSWDDTRTLYTFFSRQSSTALC